MLTANYSDFSKDMSGLINNVLDTSETLIIKHKTNSGFVIMPLNEYNSLSATLHEISSKSNKSRLDSAIEKFKVGNKFSKELIEN
jgi:antitoxin YefM